MPQVFRSSKLTAVVAVLAIGLAACGGDDDDAGGTSIQARATEFSFDPASWTVNAGEEFSIEFTNGGSTEHEWAVIDLGQDIASEEEFAEDKVLLEVEAVPAGESTTGSFTIAEAGTYQVICAIPSHFNAGMEGSLTVS